MKKIFSLSICCLILTTTLLLRVSTMTAFADTSVGGTISADTTWTAAGSPYIVTASITVQGTDGDDGITTLTIEPGVEVKFNQYTYLNIGNTSGDPGAIIAAGTAEAPVTFTKNQANPWYGIYFKDTSDDATSLLDYCVIEHTASYGIRIDAAGPAVKHSIIRSSGGYGVYLYNSSPEISGCTISDNATYGIYCSSTTSKPVITGNTISGNGSYPMRIAASVFHSGNTYTNNTHQAVEMIGEILTQDTTWKNIGIPYIIQNTVTVQGTDGDDNITTLIVEPGVELKFNQNCYLNIGNTSGDPGAIVAGGTAEALITFTKSQANPWAGLYFKNTTDDATSLLDHCIIEHTASYGIRIDAAGPAVKHSTIRNSGGHGIYLSSSSPEISNSTISNNATYGIYCSSAASKPVITNNTISGNGSYPMRISASVAHSGNTYTGNTHQAVEMIGEILTKDISWKNIGIPYIVQSTVTVQGTDGDDGITTLTIEPGVELKFNQNTSLSIGNTSGDLGAIVAAGTAEAPITFTKSQANPWAGLYFKDTTDDAISLLDYCVVEHTASYGIRIDSAGPAVKHSIIRNSGGHGLYLYNSSPEISNSTISNNATCGIYCSNTTSKPVITHNTISGNGSYPMRIGAGVAHSGNTFTANTLQAVEMMGETLTQDTTWKNTGIPYIVQNTVTVQGTDGGDGLTTLTVEPGVELRFNPNCYLYIGGAGGDPGTLIAAGTKDLPVVFTAAQATPWYGINFRDTADDATSLLDRCIIEKAGTHNIRLDNAAPAITNSLISDAGNYGIYLYGAGCGAARIECSTIKNNQYGLYTYACSGMTVRDNNITDNTSYGIYHYSATELNAAGNWWGSPDGPGAAGSLIHGNVLTDPFLTALKDCDGDSDNDGLPDEWEQEHFGDLSRDRNGDEDNDTYSNWVEFLFGSDPADPANVPAGNRTQFDYTPGGRIKSVQ